MSTRYSDKQTIPNASYKYVVERDSRYIVCPLTHGDNTFSTNPKIYELDLDWEREGDPHRIIPETDMQLMTLCYRSWEDETWDRESGTPHQNADVQKNIIENFHIDLKIGNVSLDGKMYTSRFDPKTGKREVEQSRTKYKDFRSSWLFRDPWTLRNLVLNKAGVVDDSEGLESREFSRYSDRFDNKYNGSGKRIKPNDEKFKFEGPCWVRVSIYDKPHENEEFLDDKQAKKKNNNIYRTGTGVEMNCWRGGWLCYYLIKHQSGYVYGEWYCESTPGRLAKQSGDLKYENYWCLGQIWSCHNESHKQYSFHEEMIKKAGTTTTRKRLDKSDWQDLHKEYDANSFKLQVMLVV